MKWLITILTFLSLGIGISQAQETNADGIIFATITSPANLSFGDFGFENFEISSPRTSIDVRFALPATWDLVQGSVLRLELEVAFSSETLSSPDTLIGNLEVSFNDIIIDTFVLNARSPQTIDLLIPEEALISPRNDGRHTITFDYVSDLECQDNVIINIQPESQFYAVFETGELPLDLRNLPYPLYQRLEAPEYAYIVVPDNSTVSELNAALTVGSILSRETDANLNLSLIKESDVASGEYSDQHLVFVGQIQSFSDAILTTENILFETYDITDTDGVINLRVSPVNNEKALLYIGGVTEMALLKAAQSLAIEQLVPANEDNFAVISDIRGGTSASTLSSPILLSRLIDGELVIDDEGLEEKVFEFYLPSDQIINDSGQLNLNFRHSRLVDYNQSGLNIYLNDAPVGSSRLSEETAESGNIQIPLPSSFLVPGLNKITIEVRLLPRLCGYGVWFTIDPDSTLTLPEDSQIPIVPVAARDNFEEYPQAFLQNNNLEDIAFIVPQSNFDAWNAALQIAVDLGGFLDGNSTEIIELETAFAESVDETILNSQNLFVIGKVDELPILEDLSLPAPYLPNSNLIDSTLLPIVYSDSVYPQSSYLQISSSSWDDTYLAIAINNGENQTLSDVARILTTPPDNANIEGNLLLINATDVIPINVIEQAPTATPVQDDEENSVPEIADNNTQETVTAENVTFDDAEASVYQFPNWINDLMTYSLIGIGVVILSVFIFGLFNRDWI